MSIAFRLWRWLIALLLIGYALISLGIPVRALLFKLQGTAEGLTGPMLDLIASMSWLQIIAWLAALLLYLAAAVFLLRSRRQALPLSIAGALLDIGQWASLKYGGDAYEVAFSSGQQVFDYSLFGFLAIIIGSIWFLRSRSELR